MGKNNEFFERVQNPKDPEIEAAINRKDPDPYQICDILEEKRGGVNNQYLKKLEDTIIATNDIVQIYEFMFLAVDMEIPEFDRTRFEGVIRESGNSKLMCYCMGFVPDTNIKEMLKALKGTKNAKYMEMLIKNEEYEDVRKIIEQIDPQYKKSVEEAKNFDYFPESLKDFIYLKDNIEQLKQEIIIDNNNPHLITELANYIEYLNQYKGQAYDIDDLTEAQEEIQDPMQAYEYLASVSLEDKSGLIQSVIDSERVKFMYYVYEYVPGLTDEEREQLAQNIKAKDSKGKYKRKLQEGAEERGEPGKEVAE